MRMKKAARPGGAKKAAATNETARVYRPHPADTRVFSRKRFRRHDRSRPGRPPAQEARP